MVKIFFSIFSKINTKYKLIENLPVFLPCSLSINRQVEKHWYLIRDSRAILWSFFIISHPDMRNSVSHKVFHSIDSFSPRERYVFVTRYNIIASKIKKKKKKKQLYTFLFFSTRNSSGGEHAWVLTLKRFKFERKRIQSW